ncbi:MAG: hypothetical protein C4344_04240 [Acidimicrobiia bacterium]
MRRHGVPEQILTDNGRVFTNRFGRGNEIVLFDRICGENRIRHIPTAPRPTTTGKIERWHETLRREFLDGKVVSSIEDAQAQLDAWVEHYNHDRPHQSLGMVAPWERFRLAASGPEPVDVDEPELVVARPVGSVAARKVLSSGLISFASTRYNADRWLAGETVELTIDVGLVQLHHRGVSLATHARHHKITAEKAALTRVTKSESRPPDRATVSIGRVGDSQGRLERQRVLRRDELSSREQVPSPSGPSRRRRRHLRDLGRQRAHPRPPREARPHPRARALANPGGRPNRINAAS